MKQTIVLFDLDGTLIDSTEAICESFNKVFESHNKNKPNLEILTSKIGYTLEDMFEALEVPKDSIPTYVESYKKYYREICNIKTNLLPNAKDSIIEAYSFAHLGIVTTKTGKYSKELLEHFGLLKYFSCVIGREDVTYPKPNKEPVIKAINAISKNIAKDNIYLIGDTQLDIQAANDANINSIAVTTGYASVELLQKYTSNIEKDSLYAILKIKEILGIK
ncbi:MULTISPECIES: HAD family hydrolase [Helicobacter]|uniref:phosphoglycolate phosphatase n=1 Tax=Helicobacter ibis TaxID=2962633 RepID=A0ABT4VCE2_9HELI|nr:MULTISPECIES: HAD family hydrolase [Helicobacter]MDA3967624.1 HAD family hydrolase [Helicobacter sp. WB40]MDA3968378.1 HAD family hydrolase [Helicobacter ibis]